MTKHTLHHHGLLKLIIEESKDGKTGREKPRMKYILQIIKDIHKGKLSKFEGVEFRQRSLRATTNQEIKDQKK